MEVGHAPEADTGESACRWQADACAPGVSYRVRRPRPLADLGVSSLSQDGTVVDMEVRLEAGYDRKVVSDPDAALVDARRIRGTGGMGRVWWAPQSVRTGQEGQTRHAYGTRRRSAAATAAGTRRLTSWPRAATSRTRLALRKM
jgi:hypothetical protein